MRAFIAALFLAFTPGAARAAGTGCQDTAGAIALEKIRPNATGPNFVGCINRTFDILASSMAVTSTFSAVNFGHISVGRISGLSSGAPGIRVSSSVYQDSSLYALFGGTVTIGGNQFSVGGATFVVNAGLIGILTQPSFPLHVNGISKFQGDVNVSSSVVRCEGSNCNISVNSKGSNMSPSFLSGNTANYMEFGLGRASSEWGLGINDSGASLGFGAGGDLIVRDIAASKKFILGYNPTGAAVLTADMVNGRVSVGNNTSPGVPLDVTGDGAIRGALTATSSITARGNIGLGTDNNQSSTLTFGGSPGGNHSGFIDLCKSSTQRNWRIGTNDNASGALEFQRSTAAGGCSYSTPSLLIDNSNKVGISSTTPTDELGVQGNINANGYKSGGVAGVSLACSAGQAVGGATMIKGILTGTPACVAAGPAAYSSTYTVIMNDISTTGTTAGVSFAGSTVTFTTAATARLRIKFTAQMTNNTGAAQNYVSVLVDGAYLSEFGSQRAICHSNTVGGAEAVRQTCSINWTTVGTYSAASHTVSIPFWVSGGTGVLECGEGACPLLVEEVQ